MFGEEDIREACQAEANFNVSAPQIAATFQDDMDPSKGQCELTIKAIKGLIFGGIPFHRFYALMLLNMCMMKGNAIFLNTVESQILNDLTIQAVHKAHDGSVPANPYEIPFQSHLLKYIKDWGEKYPFIDGKKSAFAQAYYQLQQEGIEIPLNPLLPVHPHTGVQGPHYPPPYGLRPGPAPYEPRGEYYQRPPMDPDYNAYPPPACGYNPPRGPQRPPARPHSHINPEENAKNIISLACNFPPENWVQDQEVSKGIETEVKKASQMISEKLEASLSANPNEDVENLINLSTILANLTELIAKARKGDKRASADIPKQNPEVPLVPAYHPKPEKKEIVKTEISEEEKEKIKKENEQIAYLQVEVEKAAKKKSELIQQSAELKTKIERLEEKHQPKPKAKGKRDIQVRVLTFNRVYPVNKLEKKVDKPSVVLPIEKKELPKPIPPKEEQKAGKIAQIKEEKKEVANPGIAQQQILKEDSKIMKIEQKKPEAKAQPKEDSKIVKIDPKVPEAKMPLKEEPKIPDAKAMPKEEPKVVKIDSKLPENKIQPKEEPRIPKPPAKEEAKIVKNEIAPPLKENPQPAKVEAKPIGKEVAKAPPVLQIAPPVKCVNTPLMRNVLLNSSGKLYEDDVLRIAILRKVDIPGKIATFRINFYNHSAVPALKINSFSPSSFDNKALTIKPNIKLPLIIGKDEQKDGEITKKLLRYISKSTLYNMEYEGPDGKKKVVEIIFPINLLGFCLGLEVSEEEFNKKLKDPSVFRVEEKFALDLARIPSVDKLLESLQSNEAFKLFNLSEAKGGMIYAGLQFQHMGKIFNAHITINVKDVKQCIATVAGEKPQENFLNSILKEFIEMVSL